MATNEFVTGSLVHDPSTNKPPADAALADLRDRLARDHDGLVKKFYEQELGVRKVPAQITDAATAGQVTEFLAQCAGVIANAAKEHEREKAPYLAPGRLVDRFFNDRIKKLQDTIAPIALRLKRYRDELQRQQRAREAQAKAQAEAARRAAIAEAERLTREAERLADIDDRANAATAYEGAALAIDEANRANALLDRPPQRVKILGDYGSTAYSRESWKFEVVDRGKVPREFLDVSAPLVQSAIDRAEKLAEATGSEVLDLDIPGIRIYREESLNVRRGGAR